MSSWSLLGEFYSFVILLILFWRYCVYERSAAQNRRRTMFVQCLTMSMGLIALNVLCVYILKYPGAVPRWINVALNSLYFQWAIFTSSQFAYLLFDTILEHVYDRHCIKRATMVLSVILALSFVMIMVNLLTGAIFYIDQQAGYHRGVWNRGYYALLIAQLIFVAICYVRNRKSVGDRMRYVMRTLPPLILILCFLQFLYPDILLNGTIAAIASLLIFIAFRSHTAEQDSLTTAGSREALVDELTLRSGSGQSLQIIQVNIMNLSQINLRYSHSVGDAMLYEVAKYLRHCMPSVQVFRSGGTTFVLLLPLEEEETAEERLQSIVLRLQEDWVLGDIVCQASVAVAELRVRNMEGTPSEIIEQLAYTMSKAKRNPPLARFDSVTSQQLCRQSYLADLIRRSIDEERFQVVYQPIYCCHRDVFCSAEALLRLKDDDGAPVPPDVFIPIAEETGMIQELTWVVLEAACKTLASGELPRLESVAINLSTRQLMAAQLTDGIRDTLQKYHLSADRLKVEITEQAVLHDTEYTRRQMHSLEALGVLIHMDDFGTGYSNLSSVLNFPFSFVKLDRSLVTPVVESKQAAIMVKALLQLFAAWISVSLWRAWRQRNRWISCAASESI